MRIFTEAEQKARASDHKTCGRVTEMRKDEGVGGLETVYNMSFENDRIRQGYILWEKDIPKEVRPPRVGDSITLYSDDHVSDFRGCDFNGVPFLYSTSHQVAIDRKLSRIFGIEDALKTVVAVMPELDARQKQMVVAQISDIKQLLEVLESAV